MATDQCISQFSSEKLLFVVDGGQVWEKRGLECSTLNESYVSYPSFQGSRVIAEELGQL